MKDYLKQCINFKVNVWRPLVAFVFLGSILTGCAVDIRCAGKEQMIRYASILLDIADGTGKDFDELLLEQHGNICWIHFAVRPPSQQNRRKILFLHPSGS